MNVGARRLLAAVGILVVGGLLLWIGPRAVARPERQAQGPVDAEEVRGPSGTLFSYQGQLLEADGEAVEGSVAISFALYRQAEGGTPFWTEAYAGAQAVAVTEGLFHVLLGSLAPLDPAELTGDVYLELAVEGETLTPREPLTSVAYAVEAGGIAGPLDMKGKDILHAGEVHLDSIRLDSPHLVSGPGQMIFNKLDRAGTAFWFRRVGTLHATSPYTTLMTIGNDGAVTIHGEGTTGIEGSLQVGDNAWAPAYAGMDGDDLAVAGTIEQAGAGGARLYKVGVGRDPMAGEGSLAVAGTIEQAGAGGARLYKVGVGRDPMAGEGSLAVAGTIEQAGAGGARLYKVGVGRDPVAGEGSLAVEGKIVVGDQGSISAEVDSGGQGPHMVFQTGDVFSFQTDGGGRLRISGDQDGVTLEGLGGLSFDQSLVPGADAQYDLGSAGRRWRTAYVQSAWCGAVVEANLQTEEEQEADRIARFEEGDVLCWSAEDQRLEKCATANDRLVQAIADARGRPIVLGAEVVKVIGPVRAGDYLVSSEVPGYAMASPDPCFGTVIAQALEDLDGERGVVKAMIRKM